MTVYRESTMAGIFQNQAERYGEKACLAYKREGKYSDLSWNQINEMVRNLSSFLTSKGIKRGDRVAIFSPNRYEWWVSDLALLSIGAIDVPIYATNSAEEALYVLDHSGAKACFTGEAERLEKLVGIRDRLPNLEFMVYYERDGQELGDNILAYDDALKIGEGLYDRDNFNKTLEDIQPSDPATIIYTSGTTGPPKGVVLSHNNFVSNVNQIMADFSQHLSDQDIFLSFLPLSHVLERTAGFYLPVRFGAKVAFAESFLTIQQDLQEIRPTLIISVPRLYEKIHMGILSKLKNASHIKKSLFGWAVKVATENLSYVCTGKDRKGAFAIKFRIADKLIFSKLKAALGMDRMKFAVSGGGPLSVSDGEFFLGMGIIILEGFGLTETTPVTNVNRPRLIKSGTVGPPLPETEIKLSSAGEILIKGPQVMLGYYNDEEATREVFTDDNFFRTGDIGSIDEDGYLSITGRMKEIIITSGGKNVSPQYIENSLKDSLYIEQISVIGDRRKYLSALIIPAFDELRKWANENGINFSNNEDLVKNDLVCELYQEEVDEYNKKFSRVEQIKRFTILPNEWTQDSGELTPTLKLKRRIIEKKYAGEIDGMYAEESRL